MPGGWPTLVFWINNKLRMVHSCVLCKGGIPHCDCLGFLTRLPQADSQQLGHR